MYIPCAEFGTCNSRTLAGEHSSGHRPSLLAWNRETTARHRLSKIQTVAQLDLDHDDEMATIVQHFVNIAWNAVTNLRDSLRPHKTWVFSEDVGGELLSSKWCLGRIKHTVCRAEGSRSMLRKLRSLRARCGSIHVSRGWWCHKTSGAVELRESVRSRRSTGITIWPVFVRSTVGKLRTITRPADGDVC
jgi:hypothetical protein